VPTGICEVPADSFWQAELLLLFSSLFYILSDNAARKSGTNKSDENHALLSCAAPSLVPGSR
jgi:hypothetical protein